MTKATKQVTVVMKTTKMTRTVRALRLPFLTPRSKLEKLLRNLIAQGAAKASITHMQDTEAVETLKNRRRASKTRL
jgi:hypothetical protein